MRWVLSLSLCAVVLAQSLAIAQAARGCIGHAQPDASQRSFGLLRREASAAPSATLRIADWEESSPLWNQTLSKSTYTPYSSTTYVEQGNTQPTLGVTSSLCLSCHDGTVAVGQSAAYGTLPVTGSMNSIDSFGTNLSGTHPFSLVLPMKDASNLVASLVSQGKTADPTGAVKLINGNIECTSCHDPHVQGTDKIAQDFLVRDSSSGQMCLACHDPNRMIQGQPNPLAGWTNSIHQTATNQPAANAHVGSYSTVALNACSSCHMEHDATAPATTASAGYAASARTGFGDPGLHDLSQRRNSAVAGGSECHGGDCQDKPSLPAGTNFHDAAETAVLNNNRHATCVDCHSAHGSNQVVTFPAPPAIRPSQANVTGISATDGVTVLLPAVNQYENCLRCHGTSVGKQRLLIYGYAPTRLVSAPDPLNVIPEFSATATSSHPVTHVRTEPAAAAQPAHQHVESEWHGTGG